MSSKKQPPKKKTTSAKKPTIKKAAPVKKAQPVKKGSPKKAQPAKKTPSVKSAAVKGATVKSAPAKKTPAKSSSAKNTSAKGAPAKKGVPAKNTSHSKPTSNGKASGEGKKKGNLKNTGTSKQSSSLKRVDGTKTLPSKQSGKKPNSSNSDKNQSKIRSTGMTTLRVKSGQKTVETSATVEPSNEQKVSPVPVKDVVTEAVVQDDAILLRNGEKITKIAFFFEVDEQEDRASKKKVSSELKAIEKPTQAMRHSASLAEETPEELYARVVAELQEENVRFTKECSNQLCTKCCRNPVDPEFRVDKDLGYCAECAEILGLGHSKEARHLNYQAQLLGADSLDEARDDDDFGEAPSQEEIKDADKDLDLDDDSDMDKL